MRVWEVGVAKTNTNIDPLGAVQKKFALINLGGEIRILSLDEVKSLKAGKLSTGLSLYKRPDGRLLIERYLETLPINSDVHAIFKNFLNSPATQEFRALAFSPTRKSKSTLNLWAGPIKGEKKGDCTTLLEFLKTIICANEQETYDYLMSFLAHMIQKPEEKPGVMTVLLGKQGTGKGMFFSLLRAIWPTTTLLVNDIEQVLGRFNSILETHYVVCMDEALFSGDRKNQDRLKSHISEQTIHVEAKFQPPRNIDSIHRYFASSNHDQFAQVEMSDRRFMFYRVSDTERQNTEYFAHVYASINDKSSVGALVSHLEALDISAFQVRTRPESKEHDIQILKSLTGIQRYWFEVLSTGIFYIDALGPSIWDDEPIIKTYKLSEYYKGFNRRADHHRPLQTNALVCEIKHMCPSAKSERTRQDTSSKAYRGLQLPKLNIAREEFENYLNIKIDWGEE